MRTIYLISAILLTTCLRADSNVPLAPEQDSSVKLHLVLADFQASDREGTAAIVTESKTKNWIQFFLISKGRIQLDFPNHKIQPPDFAIKGPWERIARIPALPYPVSQAQFSDTQIDSLKRFLEKRKIEYVYHRQAVFDAKRKAVAASESLQFGLALAGKEDSEFLMEVFQVVYGHRPAAIEVERLELALD